MGEHCLMGETDPSLPSSEASQDFIKSLLVVNPASRPSFATILEHRWFQKQRDCRSGSYTKEPFSIDHRKIFRQQQAKRNIRKMVNFATTIVRFEDLMRFVETEEKQSSVTRFKKPKKRRSVKLGSMGRKAMKSFG